MDIYKIAAKNKFRFETSKGLLSVEQLWSLSLTELDEIAVSLDKKIEDKKEKKSFIAKRTTSTKETEVKLEIIIDILRTLQDEDEAKQTKLARKLQNQKIMQLIEEKENEALSKKSLKSLKEMLQEEPEEEEA